jgi:hypothetical protein
VTVTIVETSNVGVKVGIVGRGVTEAVGVSEGIGVCVAVGDGYGVALELSGIRVDSTCETVPVQAVSRKIPRTKTGSRFFFIGGAHLLLPESCF